MKNLVATLLTIAMLITGGLIAHDLFSLQSGSRPLIPSAANDLSEADRARIIQSFYEAANTALDGHDSWSLAAVVSPAVEVHLTSGAPTVGHDALRDYLTGLLQRGALSLELVRIVDGGQNVAALVEARAPVLTRGEDDGERSSLLWRSTDLFSFERGMITGYWPGAPGAPPPLLLPAAEIPAIPGDTGVSLTRLELGPAVDPVSLNAPLPHLLLIESGVFAASRETGVFAAFAGERQFVWLNAAPDESELLLRPGDALFMPNGHGPTIRGAAESVSSALSILTGPHARLYSQMRALPRDLVAIMGMHDPWRLGERLEWHSQAVTETLAVAMLPSGDQQSPAISLRGAPYLIEPGQRQTPPRSTELRLAIVRSGTLNVMGQHDVYAPASVPSPTEDPIRPGNTLFWPGEAFPILPGESLVLSSPGSVPAEILLIEISPSTTIPGASPVPPP